jgi:hypothetical protein
VLDRYRARRALRGRLAVDEAVDRSAVDAITGDRWVLTDRRLLVLHGGDIATELPRSGLAGEVRGGAVGAEVRLRAGGTSMLIGNFRGHNALTAALGDLLDQPPSE